MSSILTDYFVQKSNGLLKLSPEVSDNSGLYQMFDDGAVSVEDGEYLYALVKILKPERVHTSGVYTGVSDMYIGQALKDNGFGHSNAVEFESIHLARAEKLWRLTGVSDWVTGKLQSSLDFQPEGEYDFAFLDTECNIRWLEMIRIFPFIKPGGFIGLHDLHKNLGQEDNAEHGFAWPWGPIPQEILQWLKEDKLRVVSFPTPRGITFFYKTHPDDFDWKK